MAYSGTPSITRLGADRYVVTISETEAGAATEATIAGLPRYGRILRCKANLDSGSGSTIDPILGTASNPSGVNVVLENGTAAATVDLAPDPGATYYSAAGALYYRSVCDSGSDNAVSVEIHIAAGW